MYKFFLITLVAVMALLVAPACKKNNNQLSPQEESLRISTNAAAFNVTPGPGTDFNLAVESAMPPTGVKIEFVVKGEIDNQVYFTGPIIETLAKITGISVNNLPQQKICICTITVTSKSKSANFAQISFRVVYK